MHTEILLDEVFCFYVCELVALLDVCNVVCSLCISLGWSCLDDVLWVAVVIFLGVSCSMRYGQRTRWIAKREPCTTSHTPKSHLRPAPSYNKLVRFVAPLFGRK